ncbi:PIG-L family deacetylase [Pelagibacterales bacterium]|nr:PIG-L family deacetylase [Pelagibacterales bacterium]
MNNKILIIAPHPDDETLGCGGAILRHKKEGDKVHWLIVTNYSKDNIAYESRQKEIQNVAQAYCFDSTTNLNIETTKLDDLLMSDLINLLRQQIEEIEPNIIYAPYMNDVHTDHQIIAKAINSFSKWFRYPYIKQINTYETLSETNFNFNESQFSPNLFLDITEYLDRKIEISKLYVTEFAKHPFPRSIKAIKSSAIIRGSTSGYEYAEAFQILIKRQ